MKKLIQLAIFTSLASSLIADGWLTNAWVPDSVYTCLATRGEAGVTGVYATATTYITTNAVGEVSTNTYFNQLQYGNNSGMGLGSFTTNLSFAVIDWRAIDLYNAWDERQEVVGGSASPIVDFYRTERDNLFWLKFAIKDIIAQNKFVDRSLLTINGDFHGLPSLSVLTYTSALGNASMPTNWFDHTPWRQLSGCGIAYTNADTLAGFSDLDYGWKHVTNLMAELTMTIHAPSYEDGLPAMDSGEIDWFAVSPTNQIGAEDCDEGVLDNTDPIVWGDITTALAKDATSGSWYDGMGRNTNGSSLVTFGVRAWSHYTCLYDEGFDLDDYCAEPELFDWHPTNISVYADSSVKRLTLDLDAITNKTFDAQWYMFTTNWEVEVHGVDYSTYDGQGIAPVETNYNLVSTSVVWLVDATTNLYLGSDIIGHTSISAFAGVSELSSCGDVSNLGFKATDKKLVIDWAVTGGWAYQ